MFSTKRTYVTTLRVVMDCVNTTNVDGGEAELACDILEHVDLPRTNESVAAIPAYIQREIVHSAPPSLVTNDKKNLSVSVHYDALESQDLLSDRLGFPVHNVETMQYVRFRVSDASTQDCIVVVRHAKGISTLLYSDLVCYDDLLNHSASTAMAAYQYTKENYPALAMIAALAGALTAMLVLYRRRTRQRSGYSYLHTKNASLPRLASQKSGKTSINTDTATPAIAS